MTRKIFLNGLVLKGLIYEEGASAPEADSRRLRLSGDWYVISTDAAPILFNNSSMGYNIIVMNHGTFAITFGEFFELLSKELKMEFSYHLDLFL